MKNNHPISYESQNLQPHEMLYSDYDKEILAILHVVVKFIQYLVGSKFIIKIDHNRLRHFLLKKDLNGRKQNNQVRSKHSTLILSTRRVR